MQHHLYVAVAGEDKISIWTVDPETGMLGFQEDVRLSGAPGPLAVDPEGRFLYCGLRSTCQLCSFRVDRASGRLARIGAVPLQADPCYLATDRKGRFLLSAYYRAGLVGVHRIGTDGGATDPPVEWLVTADKAHSIQTDASNRFAFVPHVVPSNVILQFGFDERSGRLTPNAVPEVVPAAAAGPRHFCFHPSGNWVYFVNEQGSSVTMYDLERSQGVLQQVQTMSTLPDGFEGSNSCAQIHMVPSGRYLYAANRGHDSIACFSVDAATGHLTAVGQQRTEQTPRAFNVDPTGRYLYAAGLDSGKLAAYQIDAATGRLALVATYAVGERPMWVHVL